MTQAFNRIQKTIRRRRQNIREHRKFSLRLDESKNLKTDLRNKIDALKEIISHIEVVKKLVKH